MQNRALLLILSMVLAVGALPAGAQQETASLELFADRVSYAPGDTVRIAAQVSVEDGWHVNSNQPAQEWLIPTELELLLPEGWPEPSFEFPPDHPYVFPFEEEPVLVYEGTFQVIASFVLPEGAEFGAVPIDGTLRYQSCNDRQCLAPTRAEALVDIEVGATGVAAHASIFDAASGEEESAEIARATGTAATGSTEGLAGILLLAMLGGLILNAMPCVLPVLSLKIFSLVKSAGQGRSHLLMGSLATTAGIVFSFWALALAAILAARAGAAIGWGVQFQQPGFVTFLAVVVVLFSLNMWGMFEIPLPQGLARLGGSGPREGMAGHFVSGLFATLMATPCSAPFLGTAVGFALAQPAHIIFLVFTAIGIGLALPYLILGFVPATGKLLPKPGNWMITFRQIMGFLLAAAAVWLFYVLAGQITAERIAFVQLSLLALALCVWLVRQWPEGSFRRRGAVLGVVLASFGSVVLAAGAPPARTAGTDESALLQWIAFDEAEAIRLSNEEGRMVFVDFTADWCLTCKANERLVLETTETAALFEDHGVVLMKGDWTNRDDTITEFLARYGRSAVPFYILYRPGQEPHPFGELLTRDGIEKVVSEAAEVAETAWQAPSGTASGGLGGAAPALDPVSSPDESAADPTSFGAEFAFVPTAQ